MRNDGGKRIHQLRPLRDVSQVPRSEPREPDDGRPSSGTGATAIRPRLAEAGTSTSSEANGNAPRRDARAAVSQAIVDLVRIRTGTAPITAKTEMASELAIVTLGEGLTVPEKTLADKGYSALTIQVRNSLYEGMRAEAIAAVEAITGRRVAAYLTDQQHNPDLAVIAFVFEPPAGPGSE